MNLFKAFCSLSPLRALLTQAFTVENPSLQKEVFGLRFKNPVGLGAGFDKNAAYLRELETIGFGFVEVGTVTPKPQAGNDRPRLFRLKADGALINRMGFNNEGVAVIRDRLQKWKEREARMNRPVASGRMLVGGNIGKNKATPNEDAWQDYGICFTELHPYVDFFVVNVSSPNTPGLRELQEKDSLRKILTHLQGLNRQEAVQKPILLKIAPDLTITQVEDVIQLVEEINLDGLVATNTTLNRTGLTTPDAELAAIGAGGLSGRPLLGAAQEWMQFITQRRSLAVIGSGGIFTGADAEARMEGGAQLIEVWTGFIYEGPFIVRNICQHLLRKSGTGSMARE